MLGFIHNLGPPRRFHERVAAPRCPDTGDMEIFSPKKDGGYGDLTMESHGIYWGVMSLLIYIDI
jgi:hypothetical protein